MIILLTLSSSKLKVILLTLEKSKFTLCVYFNQLWASHSYLIEFGQDITPQKIIQTLSVWQKIQEPPTRPDTSHLQLFNQQKPRTGWVSQSLEASKAQIFLHTEISFKSLFFFLFFFVFFWQYCQKPYLAHKQKSVAELFWKKKKNKKTFSC